MLHKVPLTAWITITKMGYKTITAWTKLLAALTAIVAIYFESRCYRIAITPKFILFFLFISSFIEAFAAKTPIEQINYSRFSTSVEISEFIQQLSDASSLAQKKLLGHSVQGIPIYALLLSRKPDLLTDETASNESLTLMLVGSQHGSEPGGADALLLFANEIIDGSLNYILHQGVELIIIPNSNPDGKEMNRYTNAWGVNLNDDFTLLSQPESRAINDTLLYWRPDVVVDVHEMSDLEKKSLYKEGYLIDFEAQIGIANNPNVNSNIIDFSIDYILPEWIKRVHEQGIKAQRYIGAITTISQPVTNGRLWLRNLRNKSGILGSFSFVLESRIDNEKGSALAPDNIKNRVERIILNIETLVKILHVHKGKIKFIVNQARSTLISAPVKLFHVYSLDINHPRITLPLRKLSTGEPVAVEFADHRLIRTGHLVELPDAYVVVDNQAVIKEWLEQNRIIYKTISNGLIQKVTVQLLGAGEPPTELYERRLRKKCNPAVTVVSEREMELQIQKGALWIEIAQPQGRLLPLLLDPRSSSRIFSDSPYCSLLSAGKDFFIYRIDR